MTGETVKPGVLPPGKILFSPKEAATLLGVSLWYIYKLVARETLLKIPRAGRIRIPRRELVRFLNERGDGNGSSAKGGRRCA